MTNPIRVLLANREGYASVESPTKLSGFIVPFIKAEFLSILENINVSFVSADSFGASCSSDGLCSGELAGLQQGRGDFLRPPSLVKLNSLGINLTTISPAYEYHCYLAYKKQLKVNVDYSTFFDFVYSFDLVFWIILSGFFGGITIIVCLKAKQQSPNLKLSSILWSQFEFIVSQNFKTLSKIAKSSIICVLSFLLLTIGILLTTSLRTGLVSSVNYLKLETLEDILKNNYKPVTPFASSCRFEIQNGISPIVKKISSEIYVSETVKWTEFYDICRQSNHVAITDELTFSFLKHPGCSINTKDELQSPLDLSDNFIFNSLALYLINKHNSPKSNEILSKRGYDGFEKKIVQNSNLIKILLKINNIPNAPQSCLNIQVDKRESVAPITINYSFISFVILISGYLLGIIALFFEKNGSL